MPSARVRTSHFWCSFHLWTMIGSCCLQEGTFGQKSGIRGTFNYHHLNKNIDILYRAQINFFRLYHVAEHLERSFWPWIHERKVVVRAQKSCIFETSPAWGIFYCPTRSSSSIKIMTDVHIHIRSYVQSYAVNRPMWMLQQSFCNSMCIASQWRWYLVYTWSLWWPCQCSVVPPIY